MFIGSAGELLVPLALCKSKGRAKVAWLRLAFAKFFVLLRSQESGLIRNGPERLAADANTCNFYREEYLSTA
jgi:hypothetical protein